MQLFGNLQPLPKDFGNIQPRLKEPILFDDPVPSVAYKRGSGYRKGSLVLFNGQPRFVLSLRLKLVSVLDRPCPTFVGDLGCPRLPLKNTVTHVKIAEGWIPISRVKLKNL